MEVHGYFSFGHSLHMDTNGGFPFVHGLEACRSCFGLGIVTPSMGIPA